MYENFIVVCIWMSLGVFGMVEGVEVFILVRSLVGLLYNGSLWVLVEYVKGFKCGGGIIM